MTDSHSVDGEHGGGISRFQRQEVKKASDTSVSDFTLVSCKDSVQYKPVVSISDVAAELFSIQR
jgi:hypothetical protein